MSIVESEAVKSLADDRSIKLFSSLKRRGFSTEKQMKYFTYEFKKQLTLVNYTFYRRSIKGFIMSLKDQ